MSVVGDTMLGRGPRTQDAGRRTRHTTSEGVLHSRQQRPLVLAIPRWRATLEARVLVVHLQADPTSQVPVQRDAGGSLRANLCLRVGVERERVLVDRESAYASADLERAPRMRRAVERLGRRDATIR